MARRKQQNIITVLTNKDEYARAVDESNRFLVVVDVHAEWSGPTSVMEPVFRRAFVDIDRAEERLKVYSINADLLSPEQKAGLPIHGCKPLFVVFKQRVVIAKIAGANAPELESTIIDNVPAVERDD